MAPKKFRFKHEIVFISLFSVFFFLLTLPLSRTSGTISDEVDVGRFAMNILEGTNFPLLTYINKFGEESKYPTCFNQAYNFALINYLMIPVFWLFGSSVFSLKIFAVFSTWLFLILCYYLIKNRFGAVFAGFTVTLTSISPVFIFTAWSGVLHSEIIISMFFAASAVGILFYLKNRKPAVLFLAAFLAGLPLSIKLSAVARYMAVIIAVMLFYHKPLAAWLKKENKYMLCAAAIFFILGGGLLLQYNIISRGDTFNFAKLAYSADTHIISWGNILVHLKTRLVQTISFISEQQYYFASPLIVLRLVNNKVSAVFLKTLFFTAFFSNIGLMFLSVNKKERRLVFSVYIIVILMFFLSVFSPASFDPTHLCMIYPFFQFSAALFIRSLVRFFRKPLLSVPLAFIFVLPYPGLLYRFLTVHAESGGAEIGSPAADKLISYFEEIRPEPVYILDFNIHLHDVIPFMTKGKVQRPEIAIASFISYMQLDSIESSRDIFKQFLTEELKGKDTVYLIDNDNYGDQKFSREEVISTLNNIGYKTKKIMTFKNNYGDILYELFRAERGVDNRTEYQKKVADLFLDIHLKYPLPVDP